MRRIEFLLICQPFISFSMELVFLVFVADFERFVGILVTHSLENRREKRIFSFSFSENVENFPFFYYKILLREIEKIIYNAISFSNPLMRDSLLLI